jgi:hypothetical protein
METSYRIKVRHGRIDMLELQDLFEDIVMKCPVIC